MTSFDSSLKDRPDGPVVGRLETPVSRIIERLEQGENWDRVIKEFAIKPSDIIAALAADALGANDSQGLPLIQGPASRPALLPMLSEAAIRAVAPQSDRGTRLALSAGLLQIYDFWEASHTAAQEAGDLGESDFSSYWHAIAHRREPDPGNAAYWFRRVKLVPVLEALSRAARPIVEPEPGCGVLDRSDRWNASAMLELCTRAHTGSKEENLARRLQRVEMLVVLDANRAQAGLGEG